MRHCPGAPQKGPKFLTTVCPIPSSKIAPWTIQELRSMREGSNGLGIGVETVVISIIEDGIFPGSVLQLSLQFSVAKRGVSCDPCTTSVRENKGFRCGKSPHTVEVAG